MRIHLYDAPLVKKLQVAVRQRASRRKISASHTRWWRARGRKGNYFWILWLIFVFGRSIGARLQQEPNQKAWLVGCMSLLFAGIAIQQAKKLRQSFSQSVERALTYFYPIPEREFLNWMTLRFVAGLWWLLLLALLAVGLTEYGKGDTWILTALLGALAEFLMALTLIFLLERYVELIPRWLPLGLYAMALLVYFAPGQYTLSLQPMFRMLPTGWPGLLLLDNKFGGLQIALVATTVLLLCGTSYLAMRWLLARLERAAEFSDIRERLSDLQSRVNQGVGLEEAAEPATADQDAEERPGEDQQPPLQAAWPRQRRERVEIDWAEYVREGHWRNRWRWEAASWIERFAGWTLTEGEKWTAEFLLGGVPPNWSSRWRVSVIATACAFLTLLLPAESFRFLALIGTAISLGSGLPLLGGVWPAMEQGIVSGKLAPIHACFPLDYHRAGLAMCKINAVRTLIWAPAGLLLGILLGYQAQYPLGASTWMAGRMMLVYLAVLPLLATGKFSKTTNDSVNLRFPRLLVGLSAVLLLLLLLAGAIAAMAMEDLWSVPVLVLEAGISWGSWTIYGWYYNRREVDLLRERAN